MCFYFFTYMYILPNLSFCKEHLLILKIGLALSNSHSKQVQGQLLVLSGTKTLDLHQSVTKGSKVLVNCTGQNSLKRIMCCHVQNDTVVFMKFGEAHFCLSALSLQRDPVLDSEMHMGSACLTFPFSTES